MGIIKIIKEKYKEAKRLLKKELTIQRVYNFFLINDEYEREDIQYYIVVEKYLRSFNLNSMDKLKILHTRVDSFGYLHVAFHENTKGEFTLFTMTIDPETQTFTNNNKILIVEDRYMDGTIYLTRDPAQLKKIIKTLMIKIIRQHKNPIAAQNTFRKMYKDMINTIKIEYIPII